MYDKELVLNILGQIIDAVKIVRSVGIPAHEIKKSLYCRGQECPRYT